MEGKRASMAVCLVTGRTAVSSRTHPPIRGIRSNSGKDADSIVSFNLNAFTSYGHEQGDNAPVSEAAAFAYTTALNRFLEKDSGHRIQIGDASVVFWADATDANKAAAAESIFAGLWDDGVDEGTQAQIVGARLKQIRNGEPLSDVAPDLAEGGKLPSLRHRRDGIATVSCLSTMIGYRTNWWATCCAQFSPATTSRLRCCHSF